MTTAHIPVPVDWLHEVIRGVATDTKDPDATERRIAATLAEASGLDLADGTCVRAILDRIAARYLPPVLRNPRYGGHHMPDITVEHPDAVLRDNKDGSRTTVLTGSRSGTRVRVDGTPWLIADEPIEIHAQDWADLPGDNHQGGTMRVTLTLLAEHLHVVAPTVRGASDGA